MKHLRPINQKASRIEAWTTWQTAQAEPTGGGTEPAASGTAHETAASAEPEREVVGLQERRPPHERNGPHFPLGCSLVFFPGWEADQSGGTAGLCQPVERDLFDCHLSCFWPAHVPDQLNHAADWTGKCASAQKDWRKLDLIFP